MNNATLSLAMYLMLAYDIKDDSKERDKYFRFVQKNEDRLEADERILYERNLKKIQLKELAG